MQAIQNYGMFTDAGNQVIADLVDMARRNGFNRRSINSILLAISSNETFEEATDTVVYERVMTALGIE